MPGSSHPSYPVGGWGRVLDPRPPLFSPGEVRRPTDLIGNNPFGPSAISLTEQETPRWKGYAQDPKMRSEITGATRAFPTPSSKSLELGDLIICLLQVKR